MLVFFSIPQSKLIGYVLPAVPPLAALAAEGYLRAGAPSVRASTRWTMFSARSCSPALMKIFWPVSW